MQLLSLILLLALGFIAYQYLLPALKPPQGFLKIESNYEAEVFLGGNLIGKTPLQQKNLKVGGYSLSMKANVATLGDNLANEEVKAAEFSQKVDLNPGAITIVNYEFGPTEKFSAGEILGLREGGGISIVTSPGDAEISLNGKTLGNSPLSQIADSGIYTLTVSKKGYLTRGLGINIEEGYGLVAWVSLALDPYPQQVKKADENKNFTLFDLSTSNSDLSGDAQTWAEGIWHFQKTSKDVPEKFDLLIDISGKTYTLENGWEKKKEVKVGYLGTDPGKLSSPALKVWSNISKSTSAKSSSKKVTILDTPNAFLNVRAGPGTSFSIIQKINPGEIYELLSEKNYWYQIELSSAKSGWIASQFAKKL